MLRVPIQGLESDGAQQLRKFAVALPPFFFTQKHLLTGHKGSNIDRAVSNWETTPHSRHTQEAFGARSTVSDVNRFTTMTRDPGEEQRTEGTSPQTQVNDPPIIINNIGSR